MCNVGVCVCNVSMWVYVCNLSEVCWCVCGVCEVCGV